MSWSRLSLLMRLLLVLATLSWGTDQGRAADKNKDPMPQMTPQQMKERKVTPAQRQAAAANLKAKREAAAAAAPAGMAPLAYTGPALVTDPVTGALVPDYFGTTPNWAWSPILRKFVDQASNPIPLPDLKGLLAKPDVVTYPGTDYYEIELVERTTWKFHPDLPATKLRMYRQVPGSFYTDTSACTPPPALPASPPGDACQIANNVAVDAPVGGPGYLGPVILAQKDRPTRIKFTNSLPTTGSGGELFIPADTTVMGAGRGPDGTNYPQNRGTLHLHGGFTPWVSDGTPHQWVTPAGEGAFSTLTTGVSTQAVPDMALPAGDSMTFYWPNQQSGRLMFYHDHAYGITRLNVYAGEAAGYLLRDGGEEDALFDLGVPGTIGSTPAKTDLDNLLPLVIQDRTFVWGTRANWPSRTGCGSVDQTATGTFATDPTWCDPLRKWGQEEGSLWFPHVYMTNQNPWDLSGANAMGRWDYALWFWPPYTGLIVNGPVTNPYAGLGPPEPPVIPGTPNPSLVPEAFMDTPVVNGAAYPTVQVPAGKVRLRILNAANDRFQNLSLFQASTIVSGFTNISGGSGYTSPPSVRIIDTRPGGTGSGAAAKATIDPSTGAVTAITVTCVGSGYSAAPGDTMVSIAPPLVGTPATADAVVYTAATEVGMVPFNTSQDAITPFPDWWYTPGLNFVFDDRTGGVPDPRTRGPAMIQIGTEGGLLPAPALILNQPVNYTYNRKDIVVLSVQEHALLLGPAERADVIVDFSQFSGKTLILYNDAPAPIPAADQRLDYYTLGADQTGTGGAPPTQPGFGPNTRTIMRFVVGPTGTPAVAGPPWGPVDDYNTGYLNTLSLPTGLPAVFRTYQDPIVVPQSAYNAAYGTSAADVPGGTVSRISDTSLRFAPLGTPAPNACPPATTGCLRFNMKPKAIAELFELDYGRMNATLGVETPFTNAGNQTTLPFGYIDPPTELVTSAQLITPPSSVTDGTQIWKVTHNGVDTHAIHFHLFNVQVVNRVGWDGAMRLPDPNELGWKETVRANPLEDIIVALRPTTPKLQFGLPDSIRPLDVTSPLGSSGQFSPFDPLGNPVTTVNTLSNFGWEYVWHCHLLGHEENDMMRPLVFNENSATPTAPTLTLATISTTTPPFVRLDWTDSTPLADPLVGSPANEIGFLVQRAPRGGGAGAFVTIATLRPYDYNKLCAASLPLYATCTTPAVPTATTDLISYTDLTAGGDSFYRYQVVAYNSAGSATSAVASVATVGTTPAVPTALSATVASATSIQLDWTDNSSIETGFLIERCDGTAADCTTTWTVAWSQALGAHGGTGAMTYTDTGISAGATYNYRVKALGACGSTCDSAWSNVATVTATILAPTNLRPTLLASPTRVRLDWTDNANNEAGYLVERSKDGGITWPVNSGSLLPNTVTFTDNSPGPLDPIPTYLYRVTATAGTFSSVPATVSVTVGVPVAPSALAATAARAGGTNDTVTLTWSDNSNTETSSTIQRCTGTTAACALATAVWTNVTTTVPANAITYTQTGVPRATTYSYRIRAVNALGFSAWSNTATVLTP